MAVLSEGKVVLAELALVNLVDQLTHQVDDVTTDPLMTTPYSATIWHESRDFGIFLPTVCAKRGVNNVMHTIHRV